MRLFDVTGGSAVEIAARPAEVERDLQDMVEANMEAMLGVRFLAGEYSTGPVHAGRIDSLGLDENGSPVVVELKRGRDAGVIAQGLYYLAWLTDHRAEFQQLVRDRLGADAASQVLWSSPRLICIAESFTRYDVHAVREIRRTIDLVRYSYFGTGLLALESVAKVTAAPAPARSERRRALPGSAGSGQGGVAHLRSALDELVRGLGEDVSSVDRKQYRAYRRLRNFACVSHAHQQEVVLTLRLTPKDIDLVAGFTRDVSQIGHHGTGDVEVRLRTEADLRRAEPLLRMSYDAA
ncbi:endonuclease NucS domain-containing protein [Streptomyces sp. NPDC048340]|uniref:endonuclease NucS domain-containing protein n=1 Tax=Streptomyces sp. NPDC048340 TaxID=3365537 RepID=UPI00371040EF